MAKAFINRIIENDQFYMREVEIIIPFHGEHARVTKLMEGIFRTIFTNRYLITLVDDGSLNVGFIEQIKKSKIAGVRCFRLEEQKGFGAAINYALANPWKFIDDPKKVIPFVCIMQSDTCPEYSQWLSELGATLENLKPNGVKMVSPRTNNPMSELSILKGKKGQKDKDVVLTDGFLPMYCTLCNRELFMRVGLLKEFPYAGCEAQQYAEIMQKLGFKQGISGSSWVNHDGGATLANFANDNKVQKILRNVKEKFLAEKKEEPKVIYTDEAVII